MVLGGADVQQLAFGHGIVHFARAATGCGIAQHGNHIALRFLRVVAQRIAAAQALAELKLDMGSGRERRQRRTGRVAQFDQQRVARLGADRADAQASRT